MFTRTTPSTVMNNWAKQIWIIQQGWILDQSYEWRVGLDREEWYIGTCSNAEEGKHDQYKVVL
jgi:hypothetical protein